jgi:hypothetical protein
LDFGDEIKMVHEEAEQQQSLRTSSPLDDKSRQSTIDKLKSNNSRSNSPHRPASRMAATTPVDMARAHQACMKIESILRKPGNVVRARHAIKHTLHEFDESASVDSLLLKIKLIEKCIALCAKFKRRMLQHYLVCLLRQKNEKLRERSTSGSKTPAETTSSFIPIRLNPKQPLHSSEIGAPRAKRQKLEPVPLHHHQPHHHRSSSVSSSPASSPGSSPVPGDQQFTLHHPTPVYNSNNHHSSPIPDLQLRNNHESSKNQASSHSSNNGWLNGQQQQHRNNLKPDQQSNKSFAYSNGHHRNSDSGSKENTAFSAWTALKTDKPKSNNSAPERDTTAENSSNNLSHFALSNKSS